MKRTINSTGRKRLPHNVVTVRLNDPAGGLPRSFVAHFGDLKEFKLPADARIYVEPYVASSSARFSFGTITAPASPPDTLLAEVDEGAPVLFRVRIVDETGDVGKILAAADGIAPLGRDDSDGRKSLLPIRHTDLGEELWKLDISRDGGPQLWVNNRIPGLVDRVVSDPLVQGLILPAVLREVIGALIDAEEDAEWPKDWKTFCNRLSGEEIGWDIDQVEHEDEFDDLVKRLVQRFVDVQRYASRIRESMGEHTDA